VSPLHALARRAAPVFTGVLAGALALSGCSDPKESAEPMQDSAYRIIAPVVNDGSEATVDILWNEKRCREAFPNQENYDEEAFPDGHEQRIAHCIPTVDRATGQVQMSFRLSQRDNPNKLLMLPLEKKHVAVKHAERSVPSFEFEAYNPSQPDQLFILLIDHSASMRETDGTDLTRMERVREALKANTRVFVNDKAAAAVFRFYSPGSGAAPILEGLEGQKWTDVEPITRPRAFRNELGKLGGRAGFTPIYSTITKAIGPLLDKKTGISNYLGGAKDATPTIVLLTDGFNNTRADETCGDNATGLSAALKAIKFARRKPPSKRPEVYTVGFGTGYKPGWEAPEDDIAVSPRDLCGQNVDRRIDSDLETTGIDNISLQWLAKAGGGKAFIKSDYRELSEVLAETAPKRYVWYKVRYSVDPFYHRTSFATRILITQFLSADAAVTLHPSAWFDAPSGTLPEGEERWVQPGDIRRATAFTIPALAGFILLTFLGPALFNTRRALFRRAKKTSKKK